MLPAALFLSWFTLTLSVLAYCGFGGCTADQAGSFENLPDAVVPLGLTVALIALPIFAVPWNRRSSLRAFVAIATGVVVTAAGFALFVRIQH